MNESVIVSAVIPASREKIYKGWLNGHEHSSFTGSAATASNRKGGNFTAWEGYISGKNLELLPYERIVQAWRTTEFSERDPDSKLEIILEEHKDGTKVTLKHTNIPKGQGKGYKKGWLDFYFKPMKEYFKKN
jgi:activator of HSP90 ATPase